ncbi:hypothetical protein CBL_04784 [Carabus blaptoides fortunei]
MITSSGIDTNTEKQITIFNRIFGMLSMLQTENPDKENISRDEHDIKQIFSKLAKENLERIIKYDVNLFPNFGSYDKMTDAQRLEKIEHYKVEIAKLNNELALKELETEKEYSENVEAISEEQIENLISKLDQMKAIFNDNFTDVGRAVQETEQVSHNVNFEEYIPQCSQDLKNIVEVIEKKSYVKKMISKNGLLESQPTPKNIIKDLKPNLD